MMILIDANHLAIVSLMAECKGMPEYNENLIRHIFLNQVRNIKKKYGSEYGELVLCYDARKPSWRKKVYQYYKSSRKKSREDSDIDWNQLFEFLNRFKNEIDENFPYRVISIDGAEADDIIACACKYKSTEKNLIVSNDKDFYQLHVYPNTKQYSVYHKSVVKCDHPDRYLFEHILRGDKGDGVPNYLSTDDTFVAKKRQKSITEKHIEEMWHKKCTNPNWQSDLTDELISNYNRNDILINFINIPNEIDATVKLELDKINPKNRANIHKYFAANGMNLMIENVTDF